MPQSKRAQIYAAVGPIVILMVGLGVITDTQGTALTGLGLATLTLIFACINAARTHAPVTRAVVYGFGAAVVAGLAAWGWLSAETGELILAAAMGVAGIFLAEANTPDTGADGIPDDNPQRMTPMS